MTDPLDGFRDTRPQVTEEDPETELRRRMGPDNEVLVDALILSEQMEEWINKDPVGKFLYTQANERITQCTETLFALPTLDNPKAIEAHFNGRVAISMLKLIDDAIKAGRESARLISSQDGSDITGDDA